MANVNDRDVSSDTVEKYRNNYRIMCGNAVFAMTKFSYYKMYDVPKSLAFFQNIEENSLYQVGTLLIITEPG